MPRMQRLFHPLAMRQRELPIARLSFTPDYQVEEGLLQSWKVGPQDQRAPLKDDFLPPPAVKSALTGFSFETRRS